MNPTPLSIIIPAYNEAENLAALTQIIHTTCRYNQIKYELIIVDDRSTDNTKDLVYELAQVFPVTYLAKRGPQGKAYALLEGFEMAKYELVVMIDADLQYPPQAIPDMLKKIQRGADIVVTNRQDRSTGFLRNLLSATFHTVFVRGLHQLDVDSQSGLKMFKKEILSRLVLHPKPWTFDLEFLVQARDAGYRIVSHDIEFKKRFAGSSKVNILKTTLQIGLEALRLKYAPRPVFHFHAQHPKAGMGFHYRGTEYLHYSKLSLDETALFSVTPRQKELILASFTATLMVFLLNWHLALVAALGVMTYFYFADTVFHLVVVLRGLSKSAQFTVSKREIRRIKDEDWPSYTILCPLYKEARVLKHFIRSISRLDYPKEKLQVILILEENDKNSIAHVKKTKLPFFFETLVVPHGLPKTKPKACNYALQSARGAYSVIYDAEDVPEPDQLKKAVIAFKRSGDHVRCVQAKLNFYNADQNWLTRFFTAEYSLWFHLILPGLQSLGAPIPLGGTSNHFKTEDIISLNGWDAFNVTEDCDLGIRLATRGYKTVIVNSQTFEEANSELGNWINQRTRWLKGYLQSYLVHMRKLRSLVKQGKSGVALGIQLIIGGKVIALLINPVMWILFVTYFAFRDRAGEFIESLFPPVIFYAGVFAFVLGNLLYIYYYMLASVHNRYYSLAKYALLVPVYWVMISVAAWNALAGLILRPHYWFKTKHGLHLAKTRHQKAQQKPSLALPSQQPITRPTPNKAFIQ